MELQQLCKTCQGQGAVDGHDVQQGRGAAAGATGQLGTSEASRFDSNLNRLSDSIRFDSKGIGRFEHFRIESAVPAPLLVVSLVKSSNH